LGIFLYPCLQSGTQQYFALKLTFFDSVQWINSSKFTILDRGVPLSYEEACSNAQPPCAPGLTYLGRAIRGDTYDYQHGQRVREFDFASATDITQQISWVTDGQYTALPETGYKVPSGNVDFLPLNIAENQISQVNTARTHSQFYGAVAEAIKVPYKIPFLPSLSVTESKFETEKVSVTYTSRRVRNHLLAFNNENIRLSDAFIAAVRALPRTAGIVEYTDWDKFFQLWGVNYTSSVTIGGVAFAHAIVQICSIGSTTSIDASARILTKAYGVDIGVEIDESFLEQQQYYSIQSMVIGGNAGSFNPGQCIPIVNKNGTGDGTVITYSYSDACTHSYSNWIQSLPTSPGLIAPILTPIDQFVLAVDPTIYNSFLTAKVNYINSLTIPNDQPPSCNGSPKMMDYNVLVICVLLFMSLLKILN